MKRPNLYDVLEVVREKPDCQSYVYRNMLQAKGHRELRTDLVLRRLRQLEKLDRVRITSASRPWPPFYWEAIA